VSAPPDAALAQGLERPVTHPERRRRAPVRLPPGARAAFVAVVEVVAPSRERFSFDAASHCVAFLESYLAHLPAPLRRAFPLGLLALEWGALLLGGGRRFSRLTREGRLRIVRRIERWRVLAPLGEVWTAVRGLAAAGFYSHPEVAARLGYAHQRWIDEKTRERRERFGAPEPW
jgi:hypothetical protein